MSTDEESRKVFRCLLKQLLHFCRNQFDSLHSNMKLYSHIVGRFYVINHQVCIFYYTPACHYYTPAENYYTPVDFFKHYFQLHLMESLPASYL